MPIIDLVQLQAGSETAWGTVATATVKLMGVEEYKADAGIKAEVFRDKRGSLSQGALTALSSIMPTAKWDNLGLYEDIPYILDNTFSKATPSGAGPYTRNYAAPLGTAPTPRPLTLPYGPDSTDCWAIIGALCSKLTIKGENGGPMRWSAELIGKDLQAATLVGSLLDRAVTVAMGQDVQVYIDTWAGTIGATPIPATSFAYELNIDTKRKTQQHLGALTADSYHEGDGEGWTGELMLSLTLNSTSRAQLQALLAQSGVYQRQIRIKSTSGTSVIQFDFAGTSEASPETFEDRDGVITFDVTLTDTYNPTLGNWFKAQSINSVATLA